MICYSSHENLILRQELRDPACENKRGQRLPPSSLCARGKPFLSLDCSSSPALTVKSCLLVDARLPNQVLTLTLSLSLRRACGSGASDADGLLPSGLRPPPLGTAVGTPVSLPASGAPGGQLPFTAESCVHSWGLANVCGMELVRESLRRGVNFVLDLKPAERVGVGRAPAEGCVFCPLCAKKRQLFIY